MSSSDYIEEPEWVSYALRDDFKDVEPIPIDDEPGSICPIAYSEEFSVTMSYLRALLKVNEVSERAFELVGEAIKLNPANFTAWLYRFELFCSLNKSVRQELDWIADIAEDNPKNYQLWHQRQKIIADLVECNKINLYSLESASKQVGDIDANADAVSELSGLSAIKNTIVANEIDFLNSQIDIDSKNFHAWSYRQYIVKTFDLWEYELEFSESKILQDIRNNSAWNQRYFVLTKGNGSTKINNDERLIKEINFSLEKISIAPGNESPWAYIQGLLRIHNPGLLYNEFYTALTQLGESSSFQSTIETSRFYWKYIYSYYAYLLSDCSQPEYEDMKSVWVERAFYACDFLAENLDPVRKNYYWYLKNKIPTMG